MIEAWLPYPPSANGLFSQTRAGRRFPARHYVAWRQHADMLLLAARLKPVHGPVLVEIELTPPDLRKRDADNAVKPILDSLVRMHLIADDSRKTVREIRVRWAEGKAPGALVRVSALSAEKQAA